MREYKPVKRPDGFEKEAWDNWKDASEANASQLKREIEDLSWQVSENQWDNADRSARGATVVDGMAVAARPCLSIPKIKQPMSIVANQFRSAHLGVNIHPLSEDADDDTAEVYQDLYRMMERESNAAQVRWWAFDRAEQAGKGWYRLNTVYDETTSDPNDQKVVLERILYQSSVVMDPSAVKADYSDARFGFVTAWLPLSVFKRRWPEANISKLATNSGREFDIEAVTDQTPNWAKTDGDRKSIQVAEYWCKHYETVNGRDGARDTEQMTLMWYVLAPGGEDGLEVVEEQLWNGDDIPLIPAIGTELQPFDDERRYEGMVRPARDGVKLFNFMASAATEAYAVLPKAPWVGYIDSFAPFLDAWKQSNQRNFSFLPIASAIGPNGELLPPPQRTQVDASSLQPMMLMLQMADEFIQSSTASPDAVLGRRNAKAESGTAITALQGQSEAANNSYTQNFADVTLMYEAKCALGMFRRVYDRPGRIAHLLNAEGEVRSVMLNAPFTTDDNGRPRRVPEQPQMAPMTTSGIMPQMAPQGPGMPPGGPIGGGPMPMGQPQAPKAPKPKFYDFTKGFYGVSVTVGKSYNTTRMQQSELLGSIMEKDPELGLILSPLLLRTLDGPYMKEASDLAKEYRDLKYPGLGQPKDGSVTVEMLQSKLKAAEGQIQQMTQMGQEMQKALETKQAEQQGKIEAVRIKAEADMALTQAKAQADGQSVMVKAQADGQSAEMEAMLKAKLEEIAAENAERLEAIRQEAETRRQEDQQAFEIQLEEIRQRFESMEAEKDRAAAERAAQAAAEQAESMAERESEREADKPEAE